MYGCGWTETTPGRLFGRWSLFLVSNWILLDGLLILLWKAQIFNMYIIIHRTYFTILVLKERCLALFLQFESKAQWFVEFLKSDQIQNVIFSVVPVLLPLIWFFLASDKKTEPRSDLRLWSHSLERWGKCTVHTDFFTWSYCCTNQLHTDRCLQQWQDHCNHHCKECQWVISTCQCSRTSTFDRYVGTEGECVWDWVYITENKKAKKLNYMYLFFSICRTPRFVQGSLHRERFPSDLAERCQRHLWLCSRMERCCLHEGLLGGLDQDGRWKHKCVRRVG